MVHLKRFNESASLPEGFLDFDKWVPEYFECMLKLKDMNFKHNDTLRLVKLVSACKADLNDPDKFIESCKNKYYNQDDVIDIFNNWSLISKIDISYYEDMINVIEDICDNNDLNFDKWSIGWRFLDILNLNYLKFLFVIYDDKQSIEYPNHYPKAGYNRNSNINELYDDIKSSGKIFNRYSCFVGSIEDKKEFIILEILFGDEASIKI